MLCQVDVRLLHDTLLTAIPLSVPMHEVSVVSDIVSAILKELERYNASSVEEVTLVIGDMTSLGEEQMQFAYEIVTKDTLLEGSKLIIEKEAVAVECTECGYKGPVNNIQSDYDGHSIPILSCPECGGRVKVTAGQTCSVRNLRIVEADDVQIQG
jgi:hydrogenase nickel incorporation protein HypA/HybF